MKIKTAGSFAQRILAVSGVMPALTDVLIPLALTLGALWVAALALAVSAPVYKLTPS